MRLLPGQPSIPDGRTVLIIVLYVIRDARETTLDDEKAYVETATW